MRRYSVCSMSSSPSTTIFVLIETVLPSFSTVKSVNPLKSVKCLVLLACFSMMAQAVTFDVRICMWYIVHHSVCSHSGELLGDGEGDPWSGCACCALSGAERGQCSPLWEQGGTGGGRVQGGEGSEWDPVGNMEKKQRKKPASLEDDGLQSLEIHWAKRADALPRLSWDGMDSAGLEWDCAWQVTAQERTCPAGMQWAQRNLSPTPFWHFGSLWCKEKT